jgi:hypothetical protein
MQRKVILVCEADHFCDTQNGVTGVSQQKFAFFDAVAIDEVDQRGTRFLLNQAGKI